LGQKVNPIGLRLKILKEWDSKWFAEKNYTQYLHEDFKIKKYLKKKLYHAGIAKIQIERAANKIKITINTARPGLIIGKKGVEIEKTKDEIKKQFKIDPIININEIKTPETNAQLVAENVAFQLERRVAFRRAMKRSVANARKYGVEGIKISCAGRLAGAEMARTEWYREGRVPLHTLRADIDYGFVEALTTYGIIGIKVWIFHGEKIQRGEANIKL
jgi:small subunit ribosomal protein S3